jgi:hypothetical protein
MCEHTSVVYAAWIIKHFRRSRIRWILRSSIVVTLLSNLAGNVGKCVCRLHPPNDSWRHFLMSANSSAVRVVWVRPVANTHSCVYVGISTSELVKHEDKKIWNVYHLFCILSDLSSSQRIHTTMSSTQKKAKEFLGQTRHVLTLSKSK